MKLIRTFFAVLFFAVVSKSSQAQCPPNTFLPATGNWSVAANWSCGNVPGNNELVSIPAAKVCTVDIVTPTLSNTIIWLYGELYFQCGKKLVLDCNSALVIWPGGIMQGNCAGSKLEYCNAFVWDGGDPPATGPSSYPASALPIELVSFTGRYDGDGSNVIEWKTASEIRNDYFRIEKSTNGIDFETLTIVDGAGTTSTMNYYSVLDYDPNYPITYYRLEQVDDDGKSSTSSIISVRVNKEDSGFKLFPNPVEKGQVVQLAIPSLLQGKDYTVKVIDILGNVLYFREISSLDNHSTLSITEGIHDLPSGKYIIVAESGQVEFSEKLVIQ